MAKQIKFTNEIGTFNGVEGVTEAESIHLPKAEKGTKELDLGFETIYGYEKLEPLINNARKSFQKEISKKIDPLDLEKIASGLKEYVRSSTRFSYNLDLLKASIANAYGYNLLTHRYDSADEATKQMIAISYFEKIDNLITIDDCWLIKPKSIKYYRNRAQYYTQKVISKFLTENDEEDEEHFCLYRGQGNFKYYKNEIAKNLGDTISTFTGIGSEPTQYYERQLLNSYSLNNRVAEKFMMQKNNQRRLLLTAEYNCIKDNIFSSFIVSDIFVEGQYELLALPSKNNIFITEDANDELSAEFHLSKDETTPYKLRRKRYDENYGEIN